MPQLCHHGGALRVIAPAWSYFPQYGDIGNFDPGDSMLTPQINFHFSELNFYLKWLPQNEKAPTA
jgi:hypothetical protein